MPVDLHDVVDALTSIGLEVEGVSEIFSAFDHLIIGKVIDCYSHPNADRLKVTKVDIGGGVKQIVCGASNVKKDQLVVVVLDGNELVTKKGEKFKIKKTKIRGEISEGMICAEDEIGLGDNHDGIIEVMGDLKIGSMASDYFDIKKDYVIEIGLTPNRTDAFSHIGVCKDLYAYFLHRGYDLKLDIPSIDKYEPRSALNKGVKVQVVNKCQKYQGICIENISVQPSPDWLKNKLIAIGLKPINNVVDITNFVLHETGNPLHAFDYDKILGSDIIVRHAEKGEQFKTLDNELITLNSEDLVISDADNPLCLAGVIGGLNSGISNETKNIFLESAFFSPNSVRKTAKRYNISSDASYRFERGVDFDNCEYALKRAVSLIQQICGGTIGQECKFDTETLARKEISFSFSSCAKILGHDISNNTISEILINLGFDILSIDSHGCQLSVPSFRADVCREVDVIEEVLRIYGYDNLPASKYMQFEPLLDVSSSKHTLINTLSKLLSLNGFFEMKNNSLVKEEDAALFNVSGYTPVKLLNPLSKDLGVMRTDMFVSGLGTLKHNLNRQMYNLKFFEFGKTYHLINDKYFEENKLTIFTCGIFKGSSWGEVSRDADLFLMKGVLYKLLDKCSIDVSSFDVKKINMEYSDFGLSYFSKKPLKDSLSEKSVIEIGTFSRMTLKKWGIKKPVYYIDISLDLLIPLINEQNIKYQPVSKFPSIKRDLSLVMDKTISYSDIESSIKHIANNCLQDVFLFDVYEGNKIQHNEKSYAISFLFRDNLRTLEDVEVDKEMFKIFKHLEMEYNVSLRDGKLKEY
tara:strand:+ start:5229 stop:7646 length:2418 start_codon:yes stop_codon:yes gene_type:complete